MNEIDASCRLDSELLRSFLMVARSGSITRAAVALNRTQSAVSVQVKRLETSLGVELFERQTRGVRLTLSGERLLGQASRILALIDKISIEFRGEAIEGPVAIGIPEEYGGTILPGILGEFAQAHPHVEVSVQCSFSTGFAEAVSNGRLDLAVQIVSPGYTVGELLMEEETVWTASCDLPLSPDGPLPLVLFDRACWWRDAALGSLEKTRRSHRVVFTSESVAGVKAAVGAGLGIAVLAKSWLDRGMRQLGPADGLPRLGSSRLELITGTRDEARPVAAMAAAIRRKFVG